MEDRTERLSADSSGIQSSPTELGHGDAPEVDLELEPIYDAFESAWRSDKRPALAEYVARAPKELQSRAFGHLLALDLSYRRDLGERPGVKGYRSAFPDYEGVIRDVFEHGYVHASAIRTEVFERKIGDYEIIRRLGAGGQAEVFLARHLATQRKVVLKVARHVRLDDSREHSLVNEGRILTQLEHPMLASVEEIGSHEGRPYLVMDYEKGHSLSKGVRDARMVFEKAARLVLHVAEAVATAHRRGVLHLDIKPGNVLLREDGSPCLIDFGLAQMTMAVDPNREGRHTVIGTPAFMSPEQAAGDWTRIGKRSDVFGLGSLLYWFLTGLAPFHGSTFTRCMDCARTGEIDRSYLDSMEAPRALRAIAMRAMAPNPRDRFESVDAFAEAIRTFIRRDRRRKRIAQIFSPFRNVLDCVNDLVQSALSAVPHAISLIASAVNLSLILAMVLMGLLSLVVIFVMWVFGIEFPSNPGS